MNEVASSGLKESPTPLIESASASIADFFREHPDAEIRAMLADLCAWIPRLAHEQKTRGCTFRTGELLGEFKTTIV